MRSNSMRTSLLRASSVTATLPRLRISEPGKENGAQRQGHSVQPRLPQDTEMGNGAATQGTNATATRSHILPAGGYGVGSQRLGSGPTPARLCGSRPANDPVRRMPHCIRDRRRHGAPVVSIARYYESAFAGVRYTGSVQPGMSVGIRSGYRRNMVPALSVNPSGRNICGSAGIGPLPAASRCGIRGRKTIVTSHDTFGSRQTLLRWKAEGVVRLTNLEAADV